MTNSVEFRLFTNSSLSESAFFEKVKNLLGFRAKGREVIEGFEGYQLRERSAGYDYKAFFGPQKGDIGLENTYRWDINPV